MREKKGLGYIIFEDDEFKGPISNNMKKDNLLSLKKLSGLENGDSIFFVCDKINEARKFAGIVRKKFVMNYNY